MSCAPLQSVVTVKTALDSLARDADCYHERHPDVKGLSRFCNRIKKELVFAGHLEKQLQEATEATEVQHIKLTNKVQGLKNNFRGLAAELRVAQSVPGVVGLSQSFRLNGKGQSQSRPDWPKTIEVDVVAQGGHLWIEVKDTEWFGIGSTRWLSIGGKSAGIKAQAIYQAHAAKQPLNHWRWQPPQVMYYFPSGIDSSIREELSDLGVTVSTGADISLSELPIPPPAPSATNLDVTALCALCSEVCNGNPDSVEIQAWAAHKPYLKDCIAIEKGHPLLPQLMQYLQDDRPIYAAEGAVLQFELLLAQFGGFKERDRWQGWKERISIVDDSNKDDMSPRIAALADSSSMTEAQKCIFDVGDSKQAVTITANGHALQSAAAQGVHIEAFLHKAMWLTGL